MAASASRPRFSLARVLALACLMMALPFAVSPASAEGCNPYPVGYCSTIDREAVVMCYHLVDHEYVDATVEATALADAFYVRDGPAAAFAADPWAAPLPFRTLWQESNDVAGLQVEAVTCATFEWWAECDSWMGPYDEFEVAADAQIA